MTAPTQDGLPCRVESPLGKDVLLLRRFTGSEFVSGPFCVDLEVLSTRSVAAADLLEKPIAVVFSQNAEGEERYIHGRVRSLTRLGREDELYAYRIQMVPWIWFLGLYRDCRIFQEMKVTEIVEQVFNDRGFSDFRFDCKGRFSARTFTAQYRESDLDFVSRLLEEEGIFYFFEHDANSHKLVLADHVGALQTSPIQGEVKLVPPTAQPRPEGVIDGLSLEAAVHTGKSVITDYHFEKPTADMAASVTGGGVGEIYDYPGGYVDSAQGTRFAEIRLEAEEASAATLSGQGDCVGLVPGFRFKLLDSDECDDDYLALQVDHRSGTNRYTSSGGVGRDDADDVDEGEEDEAKGYRNTFRAIPYETVYRPPRRTPVPRITGAQTAVVVGPSGEEIYTDKYGRVKVLFHWDRVSASDGKSSCWIRVASTWAGAKWGAIQIPRIGQEVVVDFLEGNPDRPIITGSVYNAQQMPPFDAKPTQSGWKSHSTKQGAARSNEFRFEDKKGSEEIYLHAEKDLVFEVVNNERGTVGHDRTITVKNDEATTVENDRTVTVKNDEAKTVENDQTLDVNAKQTVKVAMDQTIEVATGNRSVTLKQGDLTTKVSVGKIVYEATTSIELKVGANSIKVDQKGIEISGTIVKVAGKAMAEVSAPKTTVEGKGMVEVKGAMAQVNGSGMTAVKGGIIMIG